MTGLMAFFTGLDFSKILPVLKWLAIVLAAVWLVNKAVDGVQGYNSMVRESGRMGAELDEAVRAVRAAEARVESEKVARQMAEARVKLLEGDYDGYRRDSQAQIDALRKHDLRKLVNSKPKLIERLANAATADRFKQVQGLINE